MKRVAVAATGIVILLALLGADATVVTIDVGANRHPIDPRIYGLAYADAHALADLRCPLNRWGGNNTTRYNWQANADNRGADWYFESIAYSGSTAGAAVDDFVNTAKAAGVEAAVTVPTIGWVARLGANRGKLASFSISKYGAQTDADYSWFPDAGNGVSAATGRSLTGNDPADANVASTPAFQAAWVQHLVARWGAAGAGGVRHYILDNEPSIWFSTHRDVRPVGATMEDVRNTFLDYGAKIKEADPAALVLGPEEWGWSGYFYSGYDQQWYANHGWGSGSFPDRSAHGNRDYLPWLLDQLRAADAASGRRLLDVFTVHYYPQGGEFGDDVSTAMQLRRNRSTRSLWDPSYVDETWINDKVMLVPRLKQWVASFYPGTKVGITEYNWGAEGHINGATTQADVLGIFGREGLDLAARWTTPAASTPTYKAIKLYRNYDGRGSGFGDVSVAASAPSPDTLAVFAAVRSTDGALTVMAVNKATTATAAAVALSRFTPGTAAQAWQLTAANAISQIADVAVAGNALNVTLPAQSVTLFVIPRAASRVPPAAPRNLYLVIRR